MSVQYLHTFTDPYWLVNMIAGEISGRTTRKDKDKEDLNLGHGWGWRYKCVQHLHSTGCWDEDDKEDRLGKRLGFKGCERIKSGRGRQRGFHLAKTFVVEAVDLCDLPRLVVSPDESDAVRVSHLKNETWHGMAWHETNKSSDVRKAAPRRLVNSSEKQDIDNFFIREHREELREAAKVAGHASIET